MKDKLCEYIDSQAKVLIELSDRIHDNPELGREEFKACEWLTEYLKDKGFRIKIGVGGYPTAFRAEYDIYKAACGVPDASLITVGLLCEYDALEGIGHGCGHHMQGPAIIGAAAALAALLPDDLPCRIVVYGTPAEETLGAKVDMLKAGCFKDLDIAFMTHASNGTCVDNKTLAVSQYDVTFHGISSHAAISPERGRSAMDAMLLSFQGLEFLREHIPQDMRIHYCIPEAIRPVNAVPARAVASYALRSYSRTELDEVIPRFFDILKGAALMTGTTYDITPGICFDNAIGLNSVSDLLMANASAVHASKLMPPRSATGSTDFGNVLHVIPGACIRIDCDANVRGHSKELVDIGKSDAFHRGLVQAAKILAMSSYDFITREDLRNAINEEFSEKAK